MSTNWEEIDQNLIRNLQARHLAQVQKIADSMEDIKALQGKLARQKEEISKLHAKVVSLEEEKANLELELMEYMGWSGSYGGTD